MVHYATLRSIMALIYGVNRSQRLRNDSWAFSPPHRRYAPITRCLTIISSFRLPLIIHTQSSNWSSHPTLHLDSSLSPCSPCPFFFQFLYFFFLSPSLLAYSTSLSRSRLVHFSVALQQHIPRYSPRRWGARERTYIYI